MIIVNKSRTLNVFVITLRILCFDEGREFQSIPVSVNVVLTFLSFVCPKERSKEKGRQNELLR
jgi:hypothetical protein